MEFTRRREIMTGNMIGFVIWAIVGKLFVIYGVIFIALGLPLVSGQNSPFILLSVLGVMVETIVIMAIYSLCIERKYKEQ